MLAQSFSKVLVLLDYQVNKNYIAAFLCVNKAKPQLHCEGHCYLKKQLKKAGEAEKKSTAPNQKVDITLFYQAFFRITPVSYSPQVAYLPFKPVLYCFASRQNLFHPPQLTV